MEGIVPRLPEYRASSSGVVVSSLESPPSFDSALEAQGNTPMSDYRRVTQPIGRLSCRLVGVLLPADYVIDNLLIQQL